MPLSDEERKRKNREKMRKWRRENPEKAREANRRSKKNQWKSWGDFLGTARIATQLRQYKPFRKARKFVRNLQLKSNSEWRAYCRSGKKPSDLPSNTPRVYKNKGWKGWGEFLGTRNISRVKRSNEFLPWHEAKKIYQKLAKQYGIKN